MLSLIWQPLLLLLLLLLLGGATVVIHEPGHQEIAQIGQTPLLLHHARYAACILQQLLQLEKLHQPTSSLPSLHDRHTTF